MGIANCGTYVSIQLQLPWLIHPYLCVQVQHPQNKFKWGRASSIESVSGAAIYTCLPLLIWFNLHSSPVRIHRFRDPERFRKHLHILRQMSTPKSRENKQQNFHRCHDSTVLRGSTGMHMKSKAMRLLARIRGFSCDVRRSRDFLVYSILEVKPPVSGSFSAHHPCWYVCLTAWITVCCFVRQCSSTSRMTCQQGSYRCSSIGKLDNDLCWHVYPTA